jgi:DivIVA domain-containing protein
VDLSASDVRAVRFGTTRLRTGYNMAEVDAFLDTVEQAIAGYSSESVRLADEADALRSQVQQLHGRLEAMQAELSQAREQAPADEESTAENPIVVVTESAPTGASTEIIETGDADTQESLARLLSVREDVRAMLERQLELVDGVEIPRGVSSD